MLFRGKEVLYGGKTPHTTLTLFKKGGRYD